MRKTPVDLESSSALLRAGLRRKEYLFSILFTALKGRSSTI
jgi:hypothetical protein